MPRTSLISREVRLCRADEQAFSALRSCPRSTGSATDPGATLAPVAWLQARLNRGRDAAMAPEYDLTTLNGLLAAVAAYEEGPPTAVRRLRSREH